MPSEITIEIVFLLYTTHEKGSHYCFLQTLEINTQLEITSTKLSFFKRLVSTPDLGRTSVTNDNSRFD